MEPVLHSTVSNSGKQRRRIPAKAGRKAPARDTGLLRTALPAPVTLSKKSRRVVIFRTFAIGTTLLVLLSTFALWRGREGHNLDLTKSPDSLKTSRLSVAEQTDEQGDKTAQKDVVLNNEFPEEEHLDHSKIQNETFNSDREEETDAETVKANHMNQGKLAVSSTVSQRDGHPAVPSQKTGITATHHHNHDLPIEQIEWYTRDDYKNGMKPLCRISRPVVLSNGTVLLPQWMQANEKLLRKCGLGHHSFYTSLESAVVDDVADIDADFALTIHLERFQEPAHIPSVYLTEHVLKSSFLFDTFSGAAPQKEGVAVNHCIATETDMRCGLSHPEKNPLRPGIFVPRRIETKSEANWPCRFVDMFGRAHGNGGGVVHLNASSVLMRSHAKKFNNLVGTRFRSIMTTDGMFRHLPVGMLDHSTFFSLKNGIDREPHIRDKGEQCKVTIGVSTSKDTSSGFDESSTLKDKLELLLKFAQFPHAEVKEIEGPWVMPFGEYIKEMQELDVFVAGSDDDLTSIGFLPSNSVVVELMPFGVKPVTHRSLARALNLKYYTIRGKPHDDSFKQCITSEISNLRKHGKLEIQEVPQWHAPLMRAWNNAVREFIMSGSSEFDVLTSEEPVRNYFSKHCALSQKIEIGIDEAARQVITAVKELCTAS